MFSGGVGLRRVRAAVLRGAADSSGCTGMGTGTTARLGTRGGPDGDWSRLARGNVRLRVFECLPVSVREWRVNHRNVTIRRNTGERLPAKTQGVRQRVPGASVTPRDRATDRRRGGGGDVKAPRNVRSDHRDRPDDPHHEEPRRRPRRQGPAKLWSGSRGGSLV